MKKDKTSEVPVVVGDVPEHMLNLVKAGAQLPDTMETMRHHRIVNRLAVITYNSPSEKKQKYGPDGTVCIPATETVMCKPGESFEVVPIMFFDEFVQWADRNNDKTGPIIRERTLDRSSALALKCADPNKRVEPYGEKKELKAKNKHHLVFIVFIYSGPFQGTIAAISYSGGEYKKGQALMGAIQQRRVAGRQVPMFTTVWEINSAPRKNHKGEWFGFDHRPAQEPWVKADEVEPFQAMYEQALKDYKDQALEVGHAAGEEVGGAEDEPQATSDM